jgi:hypothetical protein
MPVVSHNPATEKVRNDRMQVQRAVRHGAVQVDGDRSNSDVGQDQGEHHQLPAG